MSTPLRFGILTALGIALIALAGLGWARFLELRVRTSLAEEQTRYFQEAVVAGLQQTSAVEVLEYIEAVQRYYPSGSKQKAGTHLNSMVERARTEAVERLEVHLSNLNSNK